MVGVQGRRSKKDKKHSINGTECYTAVMITHVKSLLLGEPSLVLKCLIHYLAMNLKSTDFRLYDCVKHALMASYSKGQTKHRHQKEE